MEKARNWTEIKNSPIVADAYKEDDDGVSYWVHLKSGYICTEMECGTIHERTVKDVLKLFNHTVVKTL